VKAGESERERERELFFIITWWRFDFSLSENDSNSFLVLIFNNENATSLICVGKIKTI
jgi:hypothetical protein